MRLEEMWRMLAFCSHQEQRWLARAAVLESKGLAWLERASAREGKHDIAMHVCHN